MPSPFEALFVSSLARDSFIADYVTPGKVVAAIDFWRYSVNFMGNPTIPLGANLTGLINTQGDSDFLALNISVMGFDAGTVPSPYRKYIKLQFTDRSTGKTFFNQPTNLYICSGFAGFPQQLAVPRKLRANSVTRVDAIMPSLLGSDFTSVWISLGGVRIYYQDDTQ